MATPDSKYTCPYCGESERTLYNPSDQSLMCGKCATTSRPRTKTSTHAPDRASHPDRVVDHRVSDDDKESH